MFQAFKEAMFEVEVFWIVTPCSVVVGYRRFGDIHNTTRRHSPEDLDLKRNYKLIGRLF
jgi:hypothetical protein